MLKKISKLGTVLGKKEQSKITGGSFDPQNERDCIRCRGEWEAPLCAMPINSPCA